MACNNFVSSVLARKPKVAVFDCDGTLWTNNSGEDFFYWSMEQGMVSDDVVRWVEPRYEDYRRGSVDETVMCGEMTTMYAGVPVSTLEAKVAEFFAKIVQPNVFHEMLGLTLKLRALGCELWAVSSTNEWLIRHGIGQFGFPDDHVLATKVVVEGGIATNRLLRVPSGPGKAEAIREFIGDRVDMVFGNSIHDAAMLELAEHAYAVNPTPDLEQVAQRRGWMIYWPEKSQVAAR
jgi:phosphoserine phosphatase